MLFSKEIYPGYTWHADAPAPFDELILSWNAVRPVHGAYRFMVRVQTTCWSAWLPYAEWGADAQSTFRSSCLLSGIAICQDTLEVAPNSSATAFEVSIEPLDGVAEDAPLVLYACATDRRAMRPAGSPQGSVAIQLPVKGISQFALGHIDSKRICSPTAAAAAIGFLKQTPIDPLRFASRAYDHHSDIYGNWVLNVAEAYSVLAEPWQCWVERLTGFSALQAQLQDGVPVVVSIQGPLQGSALPYEKGHLMVVCGYDADLRRVICMDPAFPADDQTTVCYPIDDFLAAWHRRLNLAYLFKKKVNFL